MSISSPPSPSVRKLVKGTHFKHYELIAPLSQGETSITWLARDLRMAQLKVALRLFYKWHDIFTETSLHQAQIAKLTEAGVWRSVPYQAYQWIEGDTLASLLRRKTRLGVELHPKVALELSSQICAALSAAFKYAAAQKKPSSVRFHYFDTRKVLIDSAGRVRLLGLTLAKGEAALSQAEQESEAIQWVGVMFRQLLAGARGQSMRDRQRMVSEAPLVQSSLTLAITNLLHRVESDEYTRIADLQLDLERLASRRGRVVRGFLVQQLHALRSDSEIARLANQAEQAAPLSVPANARELLEQEATVRQSEPPTPQPLRRHGRTMSASQRNAPGCAPRHRPSVPPTAPPPRAARRKASQPPAGKRSGATLPPSPAPQVELSRLAANHRAETRALVARRAMQKVTIPELPAVRLGKLKTLGHPQPLRHLSESSLPLVFPDPKPQAPMTAALPPTDVMPPPPTGRVIRERQKTAPAIPSLKRQEREATLPPQGREHAPPPVDPGAE